MDHRPTQFKCPTCHQWVSVKPFTYSDGTKLSCTQCGRAFEITKVGDNIYSPRFLGFFRYDLTDACSFVYEPTTCVCEIVLSGKTLHSFTESTWPKAKTKAKAWLLETSL